jgi:hypothetical protein
MPGESHGVASVRALVIVACVALVSSPACSRQPRPPAAQAAASAEPAPAAGTPHPTVSQIVAKSAESVVVVRTPIGLGTGFVVDRGIVATNLHVVAGAEQILLATSGGKRLKISAIAGLDPTHDLALLAFSADASPTPLQLRKDAPPVAGDPVIAIGTPQGLALSASTGIVSAVREFGPKLTLVQTTAPISPGSSGGPLLDENGRVIGVTTLIAKTGQNLNFAVPVQYLSTLLGQTAAPITLAEFAKIRWGRHSKDGAGNDEGVARRANRPSFPDSVAGFRLGEKLEDARASCRSRWRATVNHAECGLAPVELPFSRGSVVLYFSRDHLVAVELTGSSLEDTRTALVSKYGPPDGVARARAGREQAGWALNGGTITVNLGKNRIEILYTAQAPDVEANY